MRVSVSVGAVQLFFSLNKVEYLNLGTIQTTLRSDIGTTLGVVVQLVGLATVVDADDRALGLVELGLGHALAVEAFESGG